MIRTKLIALCSLLLVITVSSNISQGVKNTNWDILSHLQPNENKTSQENIFKQKLEQNVTSYTDFPLSNPEIQRAIQQKFTQNGNVKLQNGIQAINKTQINPSPRIPPGYYCTLLGKCIWVLCKCK